MLPKIVFVIDDFYGFSLLGFSTANVIFSKIFIDSLVLSLNLLNEFLSIDY